MMNKISLGEQLEAIEMARSLLIGTKPRPSYGDFTKKYDAALYQTQKTLLWLKNHREAVIRAAQQKP